MKVSIRFERTGEWGLYDVRGVELAVRPTDDPLAFAFDTDAPYDRPEPTEAEVAAVLARVESEARNRCWLCRRPTEEGQDRRMSDRGPLHRSCLMDALARDPV